jgi:hypothetical protein
MKRKNPHCITGVLNRIKHLLSGNFIQLTFR